jgi:hypothetical protein
MLYHRQLSPANIFRVSGNKNICFLTYLLFLCNNVLALNEHFGLENSCLEQTLSDQSVTANHGGGEDATL